MAGRFYVYEFGPVGCPYYIGKGSGNKNKGLEWMQKHSCRWATIELKSS